MLFYTLAVLSSIYSVFAIVFLIHLLVYKKRFGVEALASKANEFARTKTIVAFEAYSYISLAVWLALVLPWVDLFTVQLTTSFKDGGVVTYFGWMSSKEAGTYFVVVFLNILGVKGGLNLIDIAGMLRRGRVRLLQIPHGMLLWRPE